MAAMTLPASIANLTKPTVYVSPADTAKLVRKALKEAFPEVKFSVRTDTYAGGASIRVRWTDGPLSSQVDAIVGAFKGGDFDGMTDSMSHRTHAVDGQITRFQADFIFTTRDLDADKVSALASIFERADRNDWLTLAGKYGMAQRMLRAMAYHPNAHEFAHVMLDEMPQPQFEGRKSKTAGASVCLSRD